jgi:hypothetical protein
MTHFYPFPIPRSVAPFNHFYPGKWLGLGARILRVYEKGIKDKRTWKE